MRKKLSIVGLSLLMGVVIITGCGQKKTEMAGQSFGSISQAGNVSAEPSVSPMAVSEASPSLSPSPSPTPKTEVEAVATPAPTPKIADKPQAEPLSSKAPKEAVREAVQATEAPKQESKPNQEKPLSDKPKAAISSNLIHWDQFFDDDKQDKPSNAFWDKSGKTVQIKGFMGEVLSFDKHWFLLIPQPGAECPFDNGDETYWNKIMIVFVPDSVKLRYTSGPLLITGKLDVGIKLDESGYKTMFRLYDASFEKIKE
ncbi:hypothetical protein GCM10008018_02540 [Paenibacillus marchantiophytorum]|uniref:Lipoprotein n=1 Tax=Paenibacillus marchantiophytorum TaxID=1619310 RepID=A0ABQ2BQB5_9BACL|nr:hypothetical protein [Paenibacillus marchantiophytorum]GGI43522.1 hypothetical protein GCM10008018_02540 [Paenibacillus marchantiophytorum]